MPRQLPTGRPPSKAHEAAAGCEPAAGRGTAVCVSCSPSSASMRPRRTRHLQAVAAARAQAPSTSTSSLSQFQLGVGFPDRTITPAPRRVYISGHSTRGREAGGLMYSDQRSTRAVSITKLLSGARAISALMHPELVCLFVCLFVGIKPETPYFTPWVWREVITPGNDRTWTQALLRA